MATELAHAPLSLRERYAGLLYGALVADALALQAHWDYDQGHIAKTWGAVTDFHAPPADGYHPGKQAGDQTHYGDQTLVLMDSIEACGGNFVMEDFARRWRKFWDGTSAYRDQATKETLAHMEEGRGLTRVGSGSTDLGGAARLAPVLVALRMEDEPMILAAARAQTMLTHAAPVAVDAAEFITRTVFILMRGVSVMNALRGAARIEYRALPAEGYLQRVEETWQLTALEAVAGFGQSCPIEKALPATLAILLRHGNDFERALTENVMAGGDSAARGLMLGALLGAAHGLRGIPERWRKGLRARGKVESFLDVVGVGR